MSDLISRQALIDAVEEVPWYHQNQQGEMVHGANSSEHQAWYKAEDIYTAIETVPSAQPVEDASAMCGECDAWNQYKNYPHPGWIPCSERLPEDNRQVLVYARSVHYALAKYDEMREPDGTYKKMWVTYDAWKPFHVIKDVIEWMPLPESYRGAE